MENQKKFIGAVCLLCFATIKIPGGKNQISFIIGFICSLTFVFIYVADFFRIFEEIPLKMQYIILLRGINVGGRNIKMDELKSCLIKNGYSNPQTILQTGNLIISSKESNAERVSEKIEKMLSTSFNYPARVIAIEPKELQNILEKSPFQEVDKEFHRYILFTKNGYEETLTGGIKNTEGSDEEIHKGNGVVYWRVRKGLTLDSPFAKIIAKTAFKEFQTTRNVNTLEKILAKCES